jgi:hypothetical protein
MVEARLFLATMQGQRFSLFGCFYWPLRSLALSLFLSLCSLVLLFARSLALSLFSELDDRVRAGQSRGVDGSLALSQGAATAA